jgi:hypothetical protein
MLGGWVRPTRTCDSGNDLTVKSLSPDPAFFWKKHGHEAPTMSGVALCGAGEFRPPVSLI